MRAAALAGLLALGACGSVPTVRVMAPVVTCPAVLVAEPSPEPAGVALTAEQRLAADVGAVRALGPSLAAQDAEQRLQHEAWGRDGWSRLAAGRAWCAELDKTGAPVTDKGR